jgi:hypothetical protein
MLDTWGYTVEFKLDTSQEKQYNKLCKEVEIFARGINKRLSKERKEKNETKS